VAIYWSGFVEVYIVRIYRRDKKRPDKLNGTIEKVGIKDLCVFHDQDELSRSFSDPFPEKAKQEKVMRIDADVEGIKPSEV